MRPDPRSYPSLPRTHALVIGIGDYPYLSNGSLYKTDQSSFGLGQLTSPRLSAIRFAEWLAESLDNPDCPLGGLDVVLSDGHGAGSFGQIAAAFDQWEQDCNAHIDNVGIFYFCGHGFQYNGRQLLLAEDFGADENRIFANAIDFRTTWFGMYGCAAKTQLYLLDCCRETPFDSLFTRGNPQELKSWDGSFRQRDGRVLHAAALGRKAFGKANDVSVFTKQLISCLDSFGADRLDSGAWKLSTDSLARAMSFGIQRLRKPEITFGSGDYDSNFETDIHIVAHPRAFASVSCNPKEALSCGDLSLTGRTSYSRQPGPEPWEPDVEQGAYDLSATFSSSEYHDVVEHVPVNPPYFTWTLKVS